MKTVKIQTLSAEKFLKYGNVANLINPNAVTTGPENAPFVFYRDMVQQELFGSNPSFSTLKVAPRPMNITCGEFHNCACEICMPLDDDAIMWVAPASADPNHVPVEQIEAFYIPRGTIVMIRPGVWHHAPFPVNDKPVNLMIVLPERCYLTDCHCIDIPKPEQLKIMK